MLKLKKQIVLNQFSQNLKPFVLKTLTESLKLRYTFLKVKIDLVYGTANLN